MKFKKSLFSILLFILLNISNLVYADSLDTQLSRTKIAMGETVVVSFILNGSSNSTPDFSALEKDFNLINTNYGTAINMVNGVTSAQTFWRLTLEPKKTGSLIIPEITIGNSKSPARKLVVDEASNRTVDDKQNSAVFVEAELSTTKPYIQSQVLYTFRLFYQSQLENPRVEVPQVENATVVQLGDINYQTTIKGQLYTVAEKNFAIFPQKTGDIDIPATHFRAMTFPVDPSMMNDPFYMPQPKAMSLATKAFTLNVQAIPANFQGSTWLPAKKLTMMEQWSVNPLQWELNNPVTRTITVEAHGLRADQIPDLTIEKIAGTNMYVDPPKRSNATQGNTVVGVMEQKVTYIPNQPQSFTVPAVQLEWWNLSTNAAVSAQLNSINVHVKGTLANPAPTSSNTIAVTANAKPSVITPNKPIIKTMPFYASIWFWIAFVLLGIWLLTLWLFWQKKISNAVVLAAPIKPSVTTTKELTDKTFEQACKQGDPILAQQFLLSWAKKHWQEIPLNLDKLRELINEADFNTELQTLQQTLYAKHPTPWNGQQLFAAYKKIKSPKKHSSKKQTSSDLLPPLNPL